MTYRNSNYNLHMKVTNAELKTVVDNLNKLSRIHITGELSLYVAITLREARTKLVDFESTRVSLCESFCKKDAKGKPALNDENGFEFTTANKEKFLEKFKELAMVTVEIPVTKVDREPIVAFMKNKKTEKTIEGDLLQTLSYFINE